ncbi:unnamed protein product [marine sediment metagenome]|uniref:Uncharacterized protein n=1 Tax=marine sediment metagenome TaxID=412755 RepID=X0S495_9ZZZZ
MGFDFYRLALTLTNTDFHTVPPSQGWGLNSVFSLYDSISDGSISGSSKYV